MSKALFKKSDFAYTLPQELIASHPLKEREESRLLVCGQNELHDLRFSDITTLLRPGDLVIVNDTKVVKARLRGEKTTGGRVEILIERVESENVALCHVKSSRGVKLHHELILDSYSARLIDREEDLFRLRFSAPVQLIMSEIGEVPLPSYIARMPNRSDESRYQTVYAKAEGAVAAPTAGLHFSSVLLEQIRMQGVKIETVTLHVGAGTFQSLRENDLSKVRMHSEMYSIPERTREAIATRQGRVIAIGTTVVRTLESAELTGRDSGETRLFIAPGFRFRVVDALVTNFHLPESTLLMLVCAFAGYDRIRNAYEAAIERRYRFYSYGDAMWCERSEN